MVGKNNNAQSGKFVANLLFCDPLSLFSLNTSLAFFLLNPHLICVKDQLYTHVLKSISRRVNCKNILKSGDMIFVGEQTDKVVGYHCYSRSCSLCDKHGFQKQRENLRIIIMD